MKFYRQTAVVTIMSFLHLNNRSSVFHHILLTFGNWRYDSMSLRANLLGNYKACQYFQAIMHKQMCFKSHSNYSFCNVCCLKATCCCVLCVGLFLRL